MNRILSLLAALVLLAATALNAPEAAAQQINPTAGSVTEEQLLQALRSGEAVAGRVSIPDPNAANLIKPENRNWAGLHSGTIRSVTMWLIVAALAALVVFYLVRGRIRVDSGLSGRTITRFSGLERMAHWMLATTFIILALTGLNLIFGRQLLLPLLGEASFGTLSAWGKLAHNYLAWPFMAALVVIFLLWVGRNVPRKVDMEWLAQGGGLFSKGKHPPAGKFNAGQKILFWLVIIGGAALSYTGILMLFPAEAGTAADWQFYQTIHAIAAAVLTAVILAHIYIGSIGMEGAFDAMGSGEVDLNWAREHHPLWVQEVTGQPHANAKPAPAATPAE
ncbi:MAG: formate dehydrogenase subunit gamma [Gemmobacter sp.]